MPVTALLACLACKARFTQDSSKQSLWRPYLSYFSDCAKDINKLPLLITTDAYTKEPVTRYWGRLGASTFTSDSGRKYQLELTGSFVEPGKPPAVLRGLSQIRGDTTAYEVHREGEASIEFHANQFCTGYAFRLIDQQLSETLGFVFGIYADRKDFDKGMLDKLLMDSRSTLRTSIYATIREIVGSGAGAKDDLVAVIRIARAPYGRRYVTTAGGTAGADPIEDDSGDFGPIFRQMIPELWSGHVGQYGSTYEGTENFPEFDPSRADYLRTYTVTSYPKDPASYLTHAQSKRGIQQKVFKHTQFVSLPMEQSLRIKVPREAPGRRAAAESAAESAKRRADKGTSTRSQDVDVFYAAGELMEIGSYAIKKGYSDEVRLQFYLEFARLIQQLTKTHHVRLWNRSNSPRLYQALGFEEVGPKITDGHGTWTIQVTDPPKLVNSLGQILKKLSAKSGLTPEQRSALSQEVDGWEREWKDQGESTSKPSNVPAVP